MKEDDDERLFKEKTIDSMKSEIMEEAVQLGTFSRFSFLEDNKFQKNHKTDKNWLLTCTNYTLMIA